MLAALWFLVGAVGAVHASWLQVPPDRVEFDSLYTIKYTDSVSSGLVSVFAQHYENTVPTGPATLVACSGGAPGAWVTATGTLKCSPGGKLRLWAVNGTTSSSPVRAERSICVKYPQSITFGAIGARTYGDAFSINPVASSGLPITLSVTGPATLNGTLVTPTGAGSVTITATQPGNNDYSAASAVAQTFTVNPRPVIFTFYGGPFLYDGTVKSVSVVASDPAATYTLANASATAAGAYQATVSGSGNFSGSGGPYQWSIVAPKPPLPPGGGGDGGSTETVVQNRVFTTGQSRTIGGPLTLRTLDTVEVQNGAKVVFAAPSRITLAAGFRANPGSSFRTRITASAAVPSPAILGVVPGAPSREYVTWTPVAGVLGYRLYDTNGQVAWQSANPADRQALLIGLKPNYLYNFFLCAYTANAESARATIRFITDAPATPMNLVAAALDSGTVALSWNMPTDRTGILGYRVYDATTGQVIGTVNGPNTQGAQFFGRQPGTTYNYYVCAYGTNVLSAPSNYASVTTPLRVVADSDADGMDDAWERLYGFNPNNGADASADTDGDSLNNLDEYNACTDPKRADNFSVNPAAGPRAGVRFGVVAKGTGTLRLFVANPALGYAEQSLGELSFTNGVGNWSAAAVGSIAAEFYADSEYTIRVESSGLTDYQISVLQEQRYAGLLGTDVKINNLYLAGIGKSDIQNNRFTVRAMANMQLPFAQADLGAFETRRYLDLGLGTNGAGESAGILRFTVGSYCWEPVYPNGLELPSPFRLTVYPGFGLEWSNATALRTQLKVASGYVETRRSRWGYTVSYYAPGSYPMAAGFYDFGGQTPVVTYRFDLDSPVDRVGRTESYNGHPTTLFSSWRVKLYKTFGDDPVAPHLFEQRTDFYYGQEDVSPPGTNGYINKYFIAHAETFPWRQASAPRRGLRDLWYRFQGGLGEGGSTPALNIRAYDGETTATKLLAVTAATYGPGDSQLRQAPMTSSAGDGIDATCTGPSRTVLSGIPGIEGYTVTAPTGGKERIVLYPQSADALTGYSIPTNLQDRPAWLAGQTKERRQSWLDDDLDAATALVTSYEYTSLLGGALVLPTSTTTKQGSLTVSQQSMAYTVGTLNNRETVTTTTTTQTGDGTLISKTLAYSNRITDLAFRGKLLSSLRPDNTKTAYAYQRGTYAAGVWSASDAGNCVLVAELQGKDGSGVAQYRGVALDALDLDPDKSIVTEHIFDGASRLVAELSYLYRAGGAYDLITGVYSHYDTFGQLLRKADQPFDATGATTGRLLYEATYFGFLKQSERDVSGLRLDYVYDDYERIAAIYRSAAGSPSLGDSVSARITQYTYDGIGRLIQESVTSPDTLRILVTDTTYDTAGRPLTRTQPGGFTTITRYDSAVQTTVTQPSGATVVTALFRDGREKTTSGTAVTYSSSSYAFLPAASGTVPAGSLVVSTTAGSASQTYAKSYADWAGRNRRAITPAWGGSKKVADAFYNALGQLISEKVFDNETNGTLLLPARLYTYDAFGRQIRQATDTNNNGVIDLGTDADVKETEFDYRSTSFTRLDNGAAVHAGNQWYRYDGVKTYPYEGAQATVARYASQTYTQLSGLTDALAAHSEAVDFDRNRTQSFTTIDRVTVRQTSRTYTTGSSQPVTQVSVAGLVMESTNAQGHSTLYAYDGLGRLEAADDPRIGTTTTVYLDGAGSTTTTLTASVTAPDGKTVRYGYDTAGRQTSVTAPDGLVSRNAYDLRGNLCFTWGDTSSPAKFVYDEFNRRLEQHTYRTGAGWTSVSRPSGFDVAGDKTAWTYDAATGLLTSKTDAAGRATTYTYDALGRMGTRTDPRGVVTTYSYYDGAYAAPGAFSGLQRQIAYNTATAPAVAATPTIAYTYHRTGKIKAVTDAAGTRTFNYFETWTGDADLQGHSGRLANEVLPSGFFGSRSLTYGYQYAVAGRRNGEAASVQYGTASDYRVTYAYDATLRLAQVGSSATTLPFDYTYTAGSNLVESVAQWSGLSTQYCRTYDYQANANRLENLQHTWGANALATVESRFGYNSVGLRSSQATAGSALMTALGRASGLYTDFAYTARREVDASGQSDLTAAWGKGTAVAGAARDYNYDPIGNRTADQSGSYTANALNQYSAAPGATLAYDLAGNLTGDGTRTYTYDAENRLSSVVQSGTTSTYRYDYLGRRISKTVGSTETRFVYDGWNPIAELSVQQSTFTILRSYAWGLDASGSPQGAGGVGGLLCIASGTKRYFPIYDGSFNVIGLYDESGAIAAAYRYDPFGNLLQSAGTAATLPFGFSTKYTDRETGLLYYGLRYYSAPLGRFINRDPIEEKGGLNLYAFCGNDGVNGYDYLGMSQGGTEDADLKAQQKKNEAEEQKRREEERRIDAANDAARERQWREAVRIYGITGALAHGGAGDPNVYLAGLDAYRSSMLKSTLSDAVSGGYATGAQRFLKLAIDCYGEDWVRENYSDMFAPNRGGLWSGVGTAALDGAYRFAGAFNETLKFWKWPQNFSDLIGGHSAAMIYDTSNYFDTSWEKTSAVLEQQFATPEGLGSLSGSLSTMAVLPSPKQIATATIRLESVEFVMSGDGVLRLADARAGALFPTNAAAKAQAARLGFQPVRGAPFNTHGQQVFRSGNRFITRDVDCHSGGAWKVFDQKGRRLGTYNEDLTRKIGD